MLLTGCRIGEAIGLPWKQVDLDAVDNEGRQVGEVHLRGSNTKTRRARTIDLAVSPALHELLGVMHDAVGGKGRVFELTRSTAEAAANRMRDEYGAPAAFTWQALRRTCGTYLTNAPSIFGAASIHRSSRQLGHSTQVAERHYLGTFRGIPREARTVEAAMQIEAQLARMIATARRDTQQPRPSTDAAKVRHAPAREQAALA
ncbi:MAG TPA: tyrosine-type recombinase/integrase [Polyangiales bacterium]|nr:tyrosine-type recombinase/integrase [Polyangiales bacterium]